MFASVRDFFYRHRQKLIFGGAVIGGAALIRSYAEHKLQQWQSNQTHMLMEKQKRKKHYISTLNLASNTVLTLGSTVKEVIIGELDSDALLQTLQQHPANKLAIWQELKIIGLSRAVSLICVSAVLTTAVHVELLVLGGYTFGDLVEHGHAGVVIDSAVQQRYMLSIQYFVETGLPQLIQQVVRAVRFAAADVAPVKKLLVTQLESLLQDIILLLFGENASNEGAAKAGSFRLAPWSQYILGPIPHPGDEPVEGVVYNMLRDTADVLDSRVCGDVIKKCIQLSLNHVLDRVIDFYPHPSVSKISGSATCSSLASGITSGENAISDSREEAEPSTEALQTPSTQACSSNVAGSPVFGGHFVNSSLPLAKVIPVLCGLVHATFSPAPGQLLHKLLRYEALENFSYNVYEAFAVPVAT